MRGSDWAGWQNELRSREHSKLPKNLKTNRPEPYFACLPQAGKGKRNFFMISKKLLILIVLVVIFVGGIGYFYFGRNESQFIENHSATCKPVSGRVSVTFKDGIFPKDIKSFATSKKLSIDDPERLLSQAIIGRVSKSESQVVNSQSQQEQLRKLFSLSGISKITTTGIGTTDIATGKDLTPDVRQGDPANLGTSPRLTVTFSGNEKLVRDSIESISGIKIIEKQYLAPHVKEKTSSNQLVLQLGYQSMFDTLRILIQNFKNKINEVYLLGGSVMEIHFSSELNRKDVLDLLNSVGVQQNEFTGFDNSYNFKSAIFKVPVGQEKEWSNRLSQETSVVESARQHEICAPVIDAPI